jgi:hypothetical protein
MIIRLEHANLSVCNIDEAVRFLSAAFPDFRVRREGRNDGRRWMHFGNACTPLGFGIRPTRTVMHIESVSTFTIQTGMIGNSCSIFQTIWPNEMTMSCRDSGVVASLRRTEK